jgi:hypothetical protein
VKTIFLCRQNPAVTAKVRADKAAVRRARRERALQAAKEKAGSPEHRRHVPATELAAALRAFQSDFRAMHGGRRSSLWRLATTTLCHCNAGSGRRPPHQSRDEVARIEFED